MHLEENIIHNSSYLESVQKNEPVDLMSVGFSSGMEKPKPSPYTLV
jgi:hypothetical protein